jgi:hypothetical protein
MPRGKWLRSSHLPRALPFPDAPPCSDHQKRAAAAAAGGGSERRGDTQPALDHESWLQLAIETKTAAAATA